MLVILDNHSSDTIWCCNLGDGNGLWYNKRWSEADWLRSWAIMARRYANSSAVVGAGLRNEPRPTFMGESSSVVQSGFLLAAKVSATACLCTACLPYTETVQHPP